MKTTPRRPNKARNTAKETVDSVLEQEASIKLSGAIVSLSSEDETGEKMYTLRSSKGKRHNKGKITEKIKIYLINSDIEEEDKTTSTQDNEETRASETSTSETVSGTGAKRKKLKANKKDKDKTVKNPISTPRMKNIGPEFVRRDKVELEKSFPREKWLEMSSSNLGAAVLDHLAEIERQRLRCNNIPGAISGRIKSCGIVANNIIGALVEKLEA